MNEGIFTASASKQRKIFSQVTRAKKEIFKNASKTQPAVKEEKQMPSFQQLRYSLAEKLPTTPEVNEAVSVKKEKHSWGTMMTVHHGSDTSYPLHPEHQQAIAKLGDGEKTSFKDETNSSVHAHRDGDTVHLTRPRTSSTKTPVAHSHFNTPSEHAKPVAKKPAGEYDRKVTDHLKKKYNEEIEQGVAEENLSELKKSTLGSYVKKAANSATMSAYGAGGESQRHAGEPVSKRPDTYGADRKVALKRLSGIGKATDRLTKEANENPCWDGYKMLGMKDKGGKKVPNCIPEEQHYCAKHVYSNMFGEGLVVEGIHAEPDEEGNVEWYAVQFNEGIKKVFTEKLEVMIAEFHGNHTKKKPKR